MKRILILFVFSLFAINSFAQSSTKLSFDENQFIEVYVNERGKIFVDGKKMKLDQLEQKIIELEKKRGIIKYAKAQVKKKSISKSTLAISKLIRKYNRMIRIYKDKTFREELKM